MSPALQLAERPRLELVDEDDESNHGLYSSSLAYIGVATPYHMSPPPTAISSVTSADEGGIAAIFEDDSMPGDQTSPEYLPVSRPSTPAYVGAGVLRPAAEVNAEAGLQSRSRSRSVGSASTGSQRRPMQYPRHD